MTETDIDTTKLKSYLSEELDSVVVETEVLHDGLNLSLAISTAEDGQAYVLRQPNKFRHTELFNGLKQEYRVMERLEETTIPTPTPVLICDDESIIGEPFSVSTYLDGEPVPLGSDLPERFQNPKSRSGVADRLIDTLADIHLLGTKPFEEQCDHRTPREQVARATERLDEATSVTGHELLTLRSVGDWLQKNAPADPKTAFVHGDFRPGNVLFTGAEDPEISGVLDWETTFLGDPRTELGYVLLRWRDDDDPTPSLDELEARYSNEDAIQYLKKVNEDGLAPFTSKPGSPSRQELVARYEDKTGISFENEQFYRAHAAFMLGTVWEDLHRYQIETEGESDWEPHIEYMSMLARSIVSGEFQL